MLCRPSAPSPPGNGRARPSSSQWDARTAAGSGKATPSTSLRRDASLVVANGGIRMVPGERVGERVGDVHIGVIRPGGLNGDLGGPTWVTGDVCEVVPPSMRPWNVVGRVWGVRGGSGCDANA